MKPLKVVTITIILTIFSYQLCLADQVADAINSLQKAYPKFAWQKNSAVVIDINADGINDIAVIGYTDDKAAVGIVSGAPSKSFKTKILDFSRGHNTQQEALEEFPEGYRICDKCFEISVEDGLCDPKTIYWNYKTNELGWWRA